VAVIGCGTQVGFQLEAMRAVFMLEAVRVFDVNGTRVETFAAANSISAYPETSAPTIRAAVADADTLGSGVLVLVVLELLKPLWRERLSS
jgi:ornithine cyclodeaminase/alanine dehydrogenase-like protein (mu-crystallin family)